MEIFSIRSEDFPKSERAAIWAVELNLLSLAAFVEKFEAALRLFDHSRQLVREFEPDDPTFQIVSQWSVIAARDGAMTLYHFAKVWQVMPALVRKAPTFWQRTDQNTFNLVGGTFEERFPHWAMAHQRVAQMGDSSMRPDGVAQNATDDGLKASGFMSADSTDMFMSDNLVGRTYISSVEGKALRYDLSEDSLTKLRGVLELLKDAFEPVFDFR